MGLDQYANTVTKRGQELRKEMLTLPTNEERRAFAELHRIKDEVHEIAYWRKHADLNEWMTRLAVKKGVVKEERDFNCTDLVLTPEDIDSSGEGLAGGCPASRRGLLLGSLHARRQGGR